MTVSANVHVSGGLPAHDGPRPGEIPSVGLDHPPYPQPTQSLDPRVSPQETPHSSRRRSRSRGRGHLLRELERPGELLRHLGPNWFATVMGTGITANAAAVVPLHADGLRAAATALWAFAALLLTALTTAWAAHWIRYRAEARGHAAHPVAAHFWGAPPMALLTVGAGTLSLGSGWIGATAAVRVDAVLWTAGTLLGLFVCVWIPFRAMSDHAVGDDAAFGGWLMPVVPPMVSAATGAALVAHLPAGQPRLTLLLACYAMFGMSLLAALVVITQIWARLMRHGLGPAALVPTLWIVLGPLGQSITAANLLGSAAPLALPRADATGAQVFGLLFGVPVWGFAMMWAALAATATVRTARRGLPFSLTWWSFTFPVGTCVTGTSALAVRLGSTPLDVIAVLLYAALAGAWLLVAVRTARGAASGRLFQPPAPIAPTAPLAPSAKPVPAA